MVVINNECKVPISCGLWKNGIEKALALIGFGSGLGTEEFSVTFVNETTIKQLAGKYRNDPRATDVLAFPLERGGEVIVCPDVIYRNAEKYRVPFSEELLRVVVHGLLHLREMDHEPYKYPLDAKGLKPIVLGSQAYLKAKKMFELQESIVSQLRLDVFSPKLVVGLGNPGAKYANTRHNVGFMFIGGLLKAIGSKIVVKHTLNLTAFDEGASKYGAAIANHGDVHFALPLGGMNVSGKVVFDLCKHLKFDPREGLLVVHDDLDIRLGEYKFSYGKGRLHKGIEDVERSLKTSRFWRLRIGVDARGVQYREEGKEYVLKNFQAEEKKVVEKVLDRASKIIAEKIRLAV